jgi:MarR-like DNA-binding transcriptional regulator SgrR of sgrS sRNA
MSLAIDRRYLASILIPGHIPLPPFLPDLKEAQSLFQQGLETLNLERKYLAPLTFSYSDHPERAKIALYLKTLWEDLLGISLKLERLPWNQFRSRLEQRTLDLCCTLQDTQTPPSLELFERFEGSSSWNFSDWTHPGYRALILEAQNNLRPSWREELTAFLSTEVPFAPLFSYVHYFTHSPQLNQYRIDPEGCVDFSYATYSK